MTMAKCLVTCMMICSAHLGRSEEVGGDFTVTDEVWPNRLSGFTSAFFLSRIVDSSMNKVHPPTRTMISAPTPRTHVIFDVSHWTTPSDLLAASEAALPLFHHLANSAAALSAQQAHDSVPLLRVSYFQSPSVAFSETGTLKAIRSRSGRNWCQIDATAGWIDPLEFNNKLEISMGDFFDGKDPVVDPVWAAIYENVVADSSAPTHIFVFTGGQIDAPPRGLGEQGPEEWLGCQYEPWPLPDQTDMRRLLTWAEERSVRVYIWSPRPLNDSLWRSFGLLLLDFNGATNHDLKGFSGVDTMNNGVALPPTGHIDDPGFIISTVIPTARPSTLMTTGFKFILHEAEQGSTVTTGNGNVTIVVFLAIGGIILLALLSVAVLRVVDQSTKGVTLRSFFVEDDSSEEEDDSPSRAARLDDDDDDDAATPKPEFSWQRGRCEFFDDERVGINLQRANSLPHIVLCPVTVASTPPNNTPTFRSTLSPPSTRRVVSPPTLNTERFVSVIED